MAMGRDAKDDWTIFETLATDRMDEPDVLYIGGYPVVPNLLFALTSCNKTRVYDEAYNPTIEVDCVFAGVRVSKEASRNRALSFESGEIVEVPKVTLEVGGKTLSLRETFGLSEFIQTEDAASFTCQIADDLSIASMPDFLEKLIHNEGEFTCEYKSGTVRYYVAEASLDDNVLSVIGSVLPPDSMKTLNRTYWDKPLSEILQDLCGEMGVECTCRFIDAKVDYYQNTQSPMDGIKALCESAGLIMSWGGNILTFADVPENIAPKYTLEATTNPSDDGMEKVEGVDWRDGLNFHTSGGTMGNIHKVLSVFRSESGVWADKCLAYARYISRRCVVSCPIVDGIVQHSAVTINSNGTEVDAIVETMECDYIANSARYECCIIGG